MRGHLQRSCHAWRGAKVFRTLIVDDEPLIRTSIAALVSDMPEVFDLAGTASNGKDAWSIIQKTPVDLVFTDIRMPVLDGIELIGKAESTGNGALFFVLTAYDEFDLVRLAYDAGAKAYLLKTEICAESIRELAVSHSEEVFARRYNRANTLEHQQELRARLRGKCGATELGNCFAVVMLKPRWQKKSPRPPLGDGWARKVFAVASAELDGEKNRVAVIPDLDGTTTVVFECNDAAITEDDGGSVVERFIAAARAMAQADCGMELKGGYCPPTKAGIPLPVVYRRAQHAFDTGFVTGTYDVIRYREPQRAVSAAPHDLDINQIESRLAEYLDSIKPAESRPGIDELIQFPKEVPPEWAPALRMLYRRFMHHLDEHFEQCRSEARLQSLLAEYRIALENDLGLPCLDRRLVEYLHEASSCTPHFGRLVRRAMRYAVDRVSNPIRLEDAAAYLQVSPAHLTRTFARELGCGFAHYVAKLKIDEAKRLIRSTELKVYEISDRLGFANPETFSRTFKRISGVSPGQYV